MNDYAIVLYFDEESETSIKKIQEEVANITQNMYMIENKIPPHITILSFYREQHEELFDDIGSFSKGLIGLEIPITSIGIFNTNPAVINIVPVVTNRLKKANADIHKKLSKNITKFHLHYIEPNWVPHCAIAVKLSEDELRKAFDLTCKQFVPRVCKVSAIALVECNPYREVMVWTIKQDS
jgi:2''-5'' RNA ligase